MRNFLSCLILLLLVMLCAAPLASAQNDLTGFWVLKVPTGDGNVRETFFDLKQDGDVLTGKMVRDSRETPITDGSVKDGRIHFVITFGNPPRVRQITYEGGMED